MSSLTPKAAVLGTGHYLPEQIRTNDDLAKMVETSDAWIRERTGIRQRHIAPPGIATSDMATFAAARALEAAGISAKELDMIVVGTVTPDLPMPASAVFVQQKLGARSDCPAFDISAACAGFIFGLSIAEKYIATGAAKYVLVVGVELLSRIIDWSDRTTCVLFGDGAGAAVIGPPPGDGRGILSTKILTDGTLARSLMIPAGGTELPVTEELVRDRKNKVHMRGQDIFKVAVKNLYSASKDALDEAKLSIDQVDWVCPHQANGRIIGAVVDRLGVKPERVLMNIEQVGNTSSASIPILLDDRIRAGVVKKGDTVLMCALGAGISWGSGLIRV